MKKVTTRYYCDCCNAEIIPTDSQYWGIDLGKRSTDDCLAFVLEDVSSYDLCQDCKDTLVKFLNGEVMLKAFTIPEDEKVEPVKEEPKTEPKEEPKAPVEKVRVTDEQRAEVCKLYDKGINYAKISELTGVKYKTVFNIISKHRKGK